MYLREVKINGFKSFASKTSLHLQKGVTAIVGPNGCGKSNLAEAIRWVLGEQSAKSLRGGKMEDVIFEGTKNRKPHSMCEVSLIFTDCKERLGTEFHEVEIIRRVTREGGGKYFLNGKISRLRDIQQLFMNTGIGQVSYSFLMQGQIDQIISSSPMDRRGIFEEAAGIRKFRVQRHETMNKLSLVSRDYTRINDLCSELAKQVETLKLKAKKALEFKQLKHSFTHLELANYANLSIQFKKELDALAKLESDFAKRLKESREKCSLFEKGISKAKDELKEWNRDLENATQIHDDHKKSKDSAVKQLEFGKLRFQDFHKRFQYLDSETQQLEPVQENLVLRMNALLIEEKQKLEELQIIESSNKSHVESLQKAQKSLAMDEVLLKENRLDFSKVQSDLKQSLLRKNKGELDIQALEFQFNSVEKSLSEISDEQKERKGSERSLVESLQASNESLDAWKKKLEFHKHEKSNLETQKRERSSQVQNRIREITEISAQISILEELQNSFEGFGVGFKFVLEQYKHGNRSFSIDLVLEGVKIKHGYELAMDSTLQWMADALKVNPFQEFHPMLSLLKNEKKGKIALKLDLGSDSFKEVERPFFLKKANECILIPKNHKFEDSILEMLQGCFVCEEILPFLDFWKSNRDFKFLQVTSLSGEIVFQNGIMIGGVDPGKNESYLSRASRIAESKQKSSEWNLLLEQSQSQLLKLESKIRALNFKIKDLESNLNLQNQKKIRMQLDLENLSLRALKEKEEISRKIKTKNELIEKIQKVKKDWLGNEKAVQVFEKKISSSQLLIEQKEILLESAKTQVGILILEESDSKMIFLQRRQELEAIKHEILECLRKKEEMKLRVEKFNLERSRTLEKLKTFSTESDEIELKIQKETEILKRLSGELKLKKEAILGLQKRIEHEERAAITLRDQDRELQSKGSKIRIQLAETNSRYQALSERALDEYQKPLFSLDWKDEIASYKEGLRSEKSSLDSNLKREPQVDALWNSLKENTILDLDLNHLDWVAVQNEIKKIKKRLLTFSSVHEEAIDEYIEVFKRHRFLEEQMEDLINSKTTLERGLEKMNLKSLELFEKTFQEIRANFIYTYKKLSGGGEANLILEDLNDKLNSGIEIIARPSGTRLKSLSLLSGGQKTITAVALLFAIYLVKPSPFCVLDELDAPLDDANISRFVKMLQEFTVKSQFLIITHSNVTVAASNFIYGVTMEEKGVSKVLSMKLVSATDPSESS